ncbi:glycosyltransferase [Pseudoalteromonas luteoviolacea]|uniref:glycosyltransferase n=1 Tax=Pseudoalteromonas luteoviolacea TaxID=43657 RepID=UPI001B38D0DB|nr:glycosyltransferase [Pseudoalteromonas luteoviolacea]MBQ4838295.1 glycosyltransferase [Pseudoalteromonas luteoviolacea]
MQTLNKNNKVLFVLASLNGGGAERLSVDLANHASEMGMDVSLFVGNYTGPYVEQISHSVQVKRGSGAGLSKSLFSLAQLIRKGEFDYIFCSQEYVICITYFALLLSGKAGSCKLIAREASTPSVNVIKNFKGKLFKRLIKQVYASVDTLIAPTASVKEDIVQFYGINRRVEVLANPIDEYKIKREALENACSESLPEPYIVTVGRLIESKGVQTILAAMSKAKSSKFSLVVLGEGEFKSDLENLTRQYGLEDRVVYLGFKSNPFPYIAKASLFVLASRYEGMPNALIQASILGVPCCSSLSTGVVKELVDDNCIFQYGNDKELTTILDRVFEDKELPVNKNYGFLSPKQFIENVFEF